MTNRLHSNQQDEDLQRMWNQASSDIININVGEIDLDGTNVRIYCRVSFLGAHYGETRKIQRLD